MPLPYHRLGRAAVVTLLLSPQACDDPFEFEAQLDTAEALVTTYAFSGTSVALPAAVLVAPVPQGVRPGPEFIFDLAFDIDAAGAVRLYPVDAVARPGVIGGRTVGIAKLTGQTYESVLRAPTGGYTFGQPVTVAAGDVGVLQAVNHPSCQGSFVSTTIFAKFRVESVDAAARTMTLRVRTDPNCGFRGFETGKPSR